MLRWLLILLVLSGLVPSFGELVETVVHRVATGHFAHSAGDPHDKDAGTTEHGCGPTAHRCGCCPSQPMLARAVAGLDLRGVARGPLLIPFIARTGGDHLRDVFRPPIA